MILYLSGPMTGYPDKNHAAFLEGTKKLAKAGHMVLNPADSWGGRMDIPYEACMKLDIMTLLAAEGVATLEDWEKSKGATCEVMVAECIGLPIRPVEEWL